MKTKYIIYSILCLGLVFLVVRRINKNKAANGSTSKSSKNAPVTLSGLIVKEQTFADAVTVSGTIEANEQVQIRSEISGLVQNINFTEGANVAKGDLLIKIDDRELQAQLAQALTKEKLAAETEDRSTKLLKAEAISQEEYDNVKAELRSLQAQTQVVRAQLSKTQIRAPFSGKIGLRSISSGAYVSPTTDIANLVSINPVKISFSVPEKYAQRVKNGTAITFDIAGINKKFTATIYAKEPAINTSTRTLLLKAKAANPNGVLLPGTFANISLPLEEINHAILIPTEAVIPVLNGKQVFVKKNGKAKAVAVKSEIRTEKDLLISDGLQSGDTVITSGVMFLKPEMPVNIKVKANK